MTPERVFQILLVVGLTAGAWLYGDYWKKAERDEPKSSKAPELRAENAKLVQQIDRLEDELAQVRSMLASGPFPVPDDLTAWVEKEHNMVFLEAPSVRLASPTDLRSAAHNNLRLVYGESALQREGIVWELLGLLPPNQELTTQLLFVKSSGIKGLLDLTTGEVLLAEDFDPVSLPDRSVLVRLLGRQLSLQNHPRNEWSSRDHWQAWEAVHVGAAAALQARFLRRNQLDGDSGWTNPEPLREQILNDLAPALQGFCNFPFLEGAAYAGSVYRESRAAWAAMFRDPPSKTHHILHPKAEKTSLPALSMPEGPGELILENDLGELGLRLWLEVLLGMDRADEFASHWQGDRYHLRLDGRLHKLTWQIRLDQSEVAEKLAEEIERVIFPVLRDQQPIRNFLLTRDGETLSLKNFPEES